MAISKEDAIKELQNRDMVYVAYSQFTKLPYVKCDEETFNDQAWIFSTEEGIKEFIEKGITYNTGNPLEHVTISKINNSDGEREVI